MWYFNLQFHKKKKKEKNNLDNENRCYKMTKKKKNFILVYSSQTKLANICAGKRLIQKQK